MAAADRADGDRGRPLEGMQERAPRPLDAGKCREPSRVLARHQERTPRPLVSQNGEALSGTGAASKHITADGIEWENRTLALATYWASSNKQRTAGAWTQRLDPKAGQCGMVHGMATRVQQLEDVVRRQTDALRLQVDKVASLENEIAILKGGLEAAGVDAMAFLRSVYADPAAPLNLKIQAAATVAKIQAGPKVVNQGFVLFDYLEAKRLERIAQVKTIDANPNPPAA